MSELGGAPVSVGPLNLLILYQAGDLRKAADAKAVGAHLTAAGHRVTLLAAEAVSLASGGGEARLRAGDHEFLVSEFDAVALRTPTEVRNSRILSNALKKAGVPVFQDYKCLLNGGDKLLNYRIFVANGVPTPSTFGYWHNEVPNKFELKRFVDSLGAPPFVVKRSFGWSGEHVSFANSSEEAFTIFQKYFNAARKDQRGGALIQQFIESDPTRRRDYRVQTVVAPDLECCPEVKVVGATMRVAQPGVCVTTVSLGADPFRVSLDRAEAFAFYVTKKGMAEEEFNARLNSGAIATLEPEVRAAAEKAALAFGYGSLGVDVIRAQTGAAYVLEVNPFSGAIQSFEIEHGFSVYKPWAEGIARFAENMRRSARPIPEA